MPRILVVDDQPDSLLAAREALVAAGHVCVLAADGERALEVLAGGGIDAVVIDPAMPLHDGWPVMNAAAVPVVVVSHAPSVPGAAGVVAKPFTAPDLVAAVTAALSQSPDAQGAGASGSAAPKSKTWPSERASQ
jgi:CheY-like chemotaxis protein